MTLVYENIQSNVSVSGGGVVIRAPVRIATTVNGALATAYQNTSVVDGVALATGNRILLKNQTTGSENGIYTVNATGAPSRTSDYEIGSGVASTQIAVQEGTINSNIIYLCTNNSGTDVVGTNSLTYTELSLSANGFTMSGVINMGTNAITNVADPTSIQDVSTKAYSDLKLPLAGGVMTGHINFANAFTCFNLGNPLSAKDAATKDYVDKNVFGATTYVKYTTVSQQADSVYMIPGDSTATSIPTKIDFLTASSTLNTKNVTFNFVAGQSWKFTIDGYATTVITPPNSLGWQLRENFSPFATIETAGPSQSISTAAGAQGWTMNFIATIPITGSYILEVHNNTGSLVIYSNVRIITSRVQ